MPTATGNPPELTVDGENRARYGDPGVVASYERAAGWLDAGEQAALVSIADGARGRPLLDIGVGAGRTTPLLRLLSSDYTGVDYTPAMVTAARHRFPGLNFAHADARDLGDLEPGRFALALFSYNGIDTASPDERPAVLAAALRVLEPGGAFVFSTHNHDGGARADRPWHLLPLVPARPSKQAAHVAHRLLTLPKTIPNYRRMQPLVAAGQERGIYTSSAHGFENPIHYISAPEQARDLEAAGFERVEAYTSISGSRLALDGPRATDPWLHYVAFKPGAPPGIPRSEGG